MLSLLSEIALQVHFISLLTDRGKRESSIDYIKEAYTQGLLPNNLRFVLAPYTWPASFDENECRANHQKEVKILMTALKAISDNRLDILQISLDKIKDEIDLIFLYESYFDFVLNFIQ